jgi:hypothetical protein
MSAAHVDAELGVLDGEQSAQCRRSTVASVSASRMSSESNVWKYEDKMNVLQVMVWGAFSYNYKLLLVFWPIGEPVNAETYSTRVLCDTVCPWLDHLDAERRRYYLQEDGSPIHWARRAQDIKDRCQIASLEPRVWPSMSPDLK